MKKISLLFAFIGMATFAANAQEKVTRANEPVKVAPVQKVDKGAPAVAPVASPAPVSEVKSTPAPASTNTSATGATTTAAPSPKLKRTEVKTTKTPQKAVLIDKTREQK